MIEWQGPDMKPWLRAIALAVIGAFLFSQVTWAAGIQPVMSQQSRQIRYYNPNHHNKYFKDLLHQIKDEIFSIFSVPQAYAAQPFGDKDDYELVPYGYRQTWKIAADAVVITNNSEETVSTTVSSLPETVSNTKNRPLI